MFSLFRKKENEPEKAKLRSRSAVKHGDHKLIHFEQPTGSNYTKDGAAWNVPTIKGAGHGADPQMAEYFSDNGFIGYQLCAHMAKHWLIDKACSMPARDAVRQGWEIQSSDETRERLEYFDSQKKIMGKIQSFVRFGRAYGGALAMFDIATDNPGEFYESPFNIDGVGRGSYRGIILIDPVDVSPILTSESVQDPANSMYMKPTYWMIGGRKYHHSHFVQFVPYPVCRLARHRYNYFGVSVPERIYRRVYAAEKTADEAPALTMTKRLVALSIAGLIDASDEVLETNLSFLTELRDNFGVLAIDGEDSVTQLETSLGDLDETIMTQYQLVAAAANVPATKLIETTPKGFNSTGEYEEAVYREVLESIQSSDLQPLLERHYEIATKHLGIKERVQFRWMPLDSPTAKEYADIEHVKAQTALIYSQTGALDAYDIRERLSEDKESEYYGINIDEIDEEKTRLGRGEEAGGLDW